MLPRWAILCWILLLAAAARAGTPGEFRGEIVSPPPTEASSVHYIYVLGRNHLIRKVDIENAQVIYASSIPEVERKHHPKSSLLEGAEVRITAAQSSKGDWTAQRVEILHTSPPSKTDANAAKI
jgi:hypothetical protein